MEKKSPIWQICDAFAQSNAFKKYAKKHPREFESVFSNLDKIMGLLEAGHKVGGFQVSFFRSEGDGVYRIGQSGLPSAKESRLYVYPDTAKQKMHILHIGDKDSQQDDIKESKEIVERIRRDAS